MDTKKIEALLEGVANKEDIISAINAENGKDVQKHKTKAEELEGKLNTVNAENITQINM